MATDSVCPICKGTRLVTTSLFFRETTVECSRCKIAVLTSAAKMKDEEARVFRAECEEAIAAIRARCQHDWEWQDSYGQEDWKRCRICGKEEE